MKFDLCHFILFICLPCFLSDRKNVINLGVESKKIMVSLLSSSPLSGMKKVIKIYINYINTLLIWQNQYFNSVQDNSRHLYIRNSNRRSSDPTRRKRSSSHSYPNPMESCTTFPRRICKTEA